MKKLIKLIFLILIVLFTILFLNKNNNYYENQKILTEESIIRFEEDLKSGKEIKASNYINPTKDYSNKANKLGIKCSNIIEKIVNRCLKRLLDYLEQ